MLMLLVVSVRQSPLAVRFLVKAKFPGALRGPHALIGVGAAARAGVLPASAQRPNASNVTSFKARIDFSNMSFFLWYKAKSTGRTFAVENLRVVISETSRRVVANVGAGAVRQVFVQVGPSVAFRQDSNCVSRA